MTTISYERIARTALMLCLISARCAALAPVVLTHRSGDDTEAAWSPDGRRIVFQSDRDGDLDLYLLELASGEVTPLVAGPGNACYPAWSPDGSLIVYSYGNIERTAVQGIEDGYNLFVVAADGGTPRRLTSGLVRDYTPTFSPDGAYVYFSSTRSLTETSACVQRVAVAGGTPETVVGSDRHDLGYVQPDISADGRFIACGYVRGFRSNWQLRLIKTQHPEQYFVLSSPDTALYAPRWSPDGKLLACTGFVPGDPGWGIVLVGVQTGGTMRIDVGPGNSRSPAWSPDGRTLVFENNGTGSYKLYRVAVPVVLPAVKSAEKPETPLRPVLHFSFQTAPGATVTDLSRQGNNGTVTGTLPWSEDGAVALEEGYLTVAAPKSLDFGKKAFSVAATVKAAEDAVELQMLAVGDYADNSRGWQLYVHPDRHVWFSARGPGGEFVGSRSNEPLPLGRKVHLAGIRYADGTVELFVDGVLQELIGTGATRAYASIKQVHIGRSANGADPFPGKLYEFKVCEGVLLTDPDRARTLAEFLQE